MGQQSARHLHQYRLECDVDAILRTSSPTQQEMVLTNTLLSNGMVFIWGSKTNIGEMMDYFDRMGYVYAENFTFVLLSRSKIPQKSQKQLAGNKSLLNFFSRPKAT
jgi:hypothetical protein